ncbi:MAG: glucosaminidase domain-containing protein [Ginsengibacter sp.]
MKKILFLLLVTFTFSFPTFAQYITAEQYIADHKDMAIREMKRMGIPAAITLAQGLLETENGNSDLVKKSNNHFGIKCKSSWTAGGVSHDDDAPGECFRMYKDADESYRDHSNYLRGNDRYSFLFKLDPQDYKGWAYGLRKAGYATNPKYPDILIRNIENNNLEQYTMMAVNDVPVFDASKYKDDPEDKSIQDVLQSTGQNVTPESTEVSPVANITLNGKKALFANRGTSLLAIATAHNINLGKLLEYNDLDKDGLLDKDQFIFLERKQKEGNQDYYIAGKDENLYDVAQKNGVLLQSICAYNNVSAADNIYAGTKILLRPSGTNVQASSISYVEPGAKVKTKTSTTQPAYHAVQAKEGLYSISKKYGVTVAELKEWNSLSNENLQVGQQLIISK